MAIILIWIKEDLMDKLIHDIQFLTTPEDYSELTIVNGHILIRCKNRIALDLIDHVYEKYKGELKSIRSMIYGNWRPDKEVAE